ncbi:MAG TPA: hypothetical protein VMV04_24720 [Thermodesulfobacteriota bacterium]|nr:hypothetical protein [Thermodesulfobacteriota bacterium]
MKTKNTNNEKKPDEAGFLFPCGDFQKMAEMMKNCCPEQGEAIDCCSMMRRMMERSGGTGTEKTEEKPKP